MTMESAKRLVESLTDEQKTRLAKLIMIVSNCNDAEIEAAAEFVNLVTGIEWRDEDT